MRKDIKIHAKEAVIGPYLKKIIVKVYKTENVACTYRLQDERLLLFQLLLRGQHVRPERHLHRRHRHIFKQSKLQLFEGDSQSLLWKMLHNLLSSEIRSIFKAQCIFHCELPKHWIFYSWDWLNTLAIFLSNLRRS